MSVLIIFMSALTQMQPSSGNTVARWNRVLPMWVGVSGLVAVPAVVQAQPPAEAIQMGYRMLYSGDKQRAAGHFETLVKANPGSLPARYGRLMVERQRLSDEALRPNFETSLDALIAQTEERYDKSPSDGEALFYLANTHFLRAEYRVTYDKGMWGAARDGANAKGLIEKYVQQYPANGDAYFVLGMYNYYVDIAPTVIRFVSVFLALPGGDRAQGLKQVERAAAEGMLFAPVAKSMLLEIYSEYEGRGTDALNVGEELLRQYPTNDELAFKFARILGGPLIEDRRQAVAVYQGIIDRRRGDQAKDAAASYCNAVLALAQLKHDEWRVDDAIATLGPLIDGKVATPEWALPLALLARASYRATLNDPTAEADAKRVVDDPRMGPWKARANEVIRQIGQRRASGEAVVAAALIPGNRLTADGRWGEAEKAYELVRAQNPRNPFVRYRLAHLDFSRGRLDTAMPAFTSLADSGNAVNEAIRALAQLYVGRIHDLGGRRDDAKKAYDKVLADFPQQGFAVNAAKVGVLTAYRRPATTHPPGN